MVKEDMQQLLVTSKELVFKSLLLPLVDNLIYLCG